jgi:hypothetical protein
MTAPGDLGNPGSENAGSANIPYVIAFAQLILVTAFHNNYGYFRDELYYIACSNHLAWGYVDQPPLSIGLLAVIRWIAGDSLHAIRFLAALAGSGVVVLSSRMARELGGKRFAQCLTALCVVAAPVLLGAGRYFSMNAFDVLFWAGATYVVVLILRRGDQRLWLVFGALAGIGLLNKYSIGFLCVGVAAGLLLSSQRSHLRSVWLWSGAIVALLLFLPHLLWEVQNGFPSLDFMRNASRTKNADLSVTGFLLGQFRDVNVFNAPVWLLGLYYLLFHRNAANVRSLGWMYLVVFALMAAGNAKVYYLSPAYPVLFAAGAVFLEGVLREHRYRWLKRAAVVVVLAGGIIAVPFTLPVLPVEKFIAYEHALGVAPRAEERSTLGVLPQYYADMFGWEELVATVAGVYQRLTPEEQQQCVIYVRNYGEAGAVDFFGKRYRLPPALCGHNNYWLWGPGTRPGDIAIIVGDRRDLGDNLADLKHFYRDVELAATTSCRYCMPFEDGRQLFLCRGMNTTFQRIWSRERSYL